MIVICTRCQAKFRVSDEKVGPRGAKVRCSKCQTVFMVHPDLGSVPVEPTPAPRPTPSRTPPPRAPAGGLDVDLEPATGARRPGVPPRVTDPFAAADPFASLPGGAAVPARRAQAGAAPPPAGDPFAAMAGAVGSAPDPFTASALGQPSDPFAPAVAADPFSPAGAAPGDERPPGGPPDPFGAATPSGSRPLPVTDLSALLGGPSAAAPPETAVAPPAVAPPGEPDFSGDFDPGPVGPDLALEDRLTPPPLPPPLPSVEPDAGFPGGTAFEAASTADLMTFGGTPPQPVAEPPGGAARTPATRPTLAARRPAAPPPAADLPRPSALAGGSLLRRLAVNTIALAALLAVALAIRVAWTGDLEHGGLRPSALASALGRAPASPFVAVGVTSGRYERANGEPLLWVKGRVVSRAAAAVPAVTVAVEVVRDGRVLGRASALAGAVPTPEELHGALTPAAVEALAAAARRRAPKEVQPGEEVPFLVAVPDVPGDLDGAGLRLTLEAAGRDRVTR